MATLRDIKRRIVSVKNTQQLTKAMKMVAAAKLRKAQERMQQARPYSHSLSELMARVSAQVDHALHPLLAVREPRKVGIVVVSGDRGLAGGFNANIIKRANVEIAKLRQAGSEMSLICVGKKGFEFFERRNFTILEKYINFFNELKFSHAQDISALLQSQYLGEELDRVYLVYNQFKSVIQQEIIVRQVLPIEPARAADERYQVEFLFEPEPVKILDSLCPRYLNIEVWQALLESYAAELGARMSAMDAATENAQEVIEQLTLKYNKARQASITKEMLEIVSGAEALQG